MRADVGERRGEDGLDLEVDRLDHAHEVASRVAYVFQLLLQETVALLQFDELVQRERVDRAHQAQLSFEVAHAGRRVCALRHLRQVGSFRLLGFEIVVAAQRLDSGLQPHAHLGLVDLHATRALAGFVELLLGSGSAAAQRIESLRDPADLVALPTADIQQFVVPHLDDVAVALDKGGEAFYSLQAAFDGDPALGSLRARDRIGFQATLGLLQAAFEERLAFVQTGIAHFQVLPPACQARRVGIEAGAGFTAGPRGLGLGRLVGLQCGHQPVQLADAGSLALGALVGIAETALDRFDLGLRLASLGLRAGQGLAVGGEAGVVDIELAGEIGLVVAGRMQLGLGAGERSVAVGQLCGRHRRPLLGFLQRRRCGAAAGGADAPAGGSEPVAGGGDYHSQRVPDGEVEGLVPAADTHCPAEHRVEQLGHTRVAAPYMRAHRVATASGRRGACVAAPQCDHGAVHVVGLQRLQCAATGIG